MTLARENNSDSKNFILAWCFCYPDMLSIPFICSCDGKGTIFPCNVQHFPLLNLMFIENSWLKCVDKQSATPFPSESHFLIISLTIFVADGHRPRRGLTDYCRPITSLSFLICSSTSPNVASPLWAKHKNPLCGCDKWDDTFHGWWHIQYNILEHKSVVDSGRYDHQKCNSPIACPSSWLSDFAVLHHRQKTVRW